MTCSLNKSFDYCFQLDYCWNIIIFHTRLGLSKSFYENRKQTPANLSNEFYKNFFKNLQPWLGELPMSGTLSHALDISLEIHLGVKRPRQRSLINQSCFVSVYPFKSLNSSLTLSLVVRKTSNDSLFETWTFFPGSPLTHMEVFILPFPSFHENVSVPSDLLFNLSRHQFDFEIKHLILN